MSTGSRPSKRMFKVLFLSIHHHFGGGESSLLYLADALREKVEPFVLLRRKGKFEDILKKRGIRVIISNSFFSYRKYWYLNPSKLKRFIDATAVMSRLKPDIVHANTLEASFPFIFSAWLLKVPFIVTIRGPWEIRRDYFLEPVKKYARRILFTTSRMAGMVEILQNKSSIIRLGVDIERFLKIKKRKEGDEIIIGCLGRYSPEKGQHLLLAAIAQLRRELRIPIRVIFMGERSFSQDRAYFEFLLDEAKKLGIEELVEFKDFDFDTPSFYSKIDILVVPSLYEMPSRVIQEGMASGLPIVSTDGGATSELIDDGVDGLLFKSGDVGDLVSKLRFLVESREKRRELGENSRKKALSFDIRKSAEELLLLYREVLSEGPS